MTCWVQCNGARRGASGLEKLAYLNDIVGFGSLCGLGQMAPGPVRSGLAHFKEAFEEAVGVGRGRSPHA